MRAAQDEVETRATEVGQIQAQLAMAQQQLTDVRIASMQATEAYNGAIYRLQQARAEARAALRRADAAVAEVEQQRRALEGFAVGSAQEATSVGQVGSLLTSGDPAELLEEYGAWNDTTNALQAALDDWDATRAYAEVLREEADAARERRADAADTARQAREVAEAAVADAEQQEAALSARTDELVRALAEAQDVSVALARQRQQALAAAAAEAAEQEAAEEAAEQEAEEQEQQEADDDEQTDDPPSEQPQQPEQPDEPGDRSNGGGGGNGDTSGDGGNGGRRRRRRRQRRWHRRRQRRRQRRWQRRWRRRRRRRRHHQPAPAERCRAGDRVRQGAAG